MYRVYRVRLLVQTHHICILSFNSVAFTLAEQHPATVIVSPEDTQDSTEYLRLFKLPNVMHSPFLSYIQTVF